MKYGICFFLLCVICLSRPCLADELSPGFDVCSANAQSTADMLECLSESHDYWLIRVNENLSKARSMCKDLQEPAQCEARINYAHNLWGLYDSAMVDALYDVEERGSISRVNALHFRTKAAKLHAESLSSLHYEQ